MFNLFSLSQKYIGIDLGTANILISLKEKGSILKEPAVVALNMVNGQILATGNYAKQMIGRTPEPIQAIRPLKDGVIADFTATSLMLENFLNIVKQRYNIGKPIAVVGVPMGITEVEEKAVQESLISAGCKEVFLVSESMASAIGIGLNINQANGSMVIDIGGGTTEIAVISLGGIICSQSIKVAGDQFDNDIIDYIKKEKNIAIGQTTAENLKIEIGCVEPLVTQLSKEIKGRNLKTGLPQNVTITSNDLMFALSLSVGKIIEAIRLTLEKTPPELASDIIENGIILCGGGALLKNFDKLISQKTKMPVHIANNPLECVVLGTQKIINDFDNYRNILINMQKRN